MNAIRREEMRKFIAEVQVVTLEQLTEKFSDISLMTIHRDLSFLQEQGFLVKIRGGARYIADSDSEPAFSAREIISRGAKQAIAQKALALLAGSSSIFIDAGTTMMIFAKDIPDIKANVVTTGPNIALELASRPLLTVNLSGGVLNKNNLTLSGSAAMDMLSGINIDTAFVVASGYVSNTGFTCGLENEAEIKKLITQKAKTNAIFIDDAKFDRVLPYTFAQLEDYDYIVTNLDPQDLPEEIRKRAKENNVTLL